MKKNQLFCLLILFILTCCSIYSCTSSGDCIPQDVKVGEILLVSNSKTFITSFKEKTAVFKDSFGQEMKFKDSSDYSIRFGPRAIGKVNCSNTKDGLFFTHQSHDYMDTEGSYITMRSKNFILSYNMYIEWSNFDVVNASVFRIDSLGCGGNTGLIITADRGKKDAPRVTEQFRTISDTLINGKSFKNILGRWKDEYRLCCCGIKAPSNDTPNEVFFDRQKGIIAFKMLNGQTWTLDRIE